MPEQPTGKTICMRGQWGHDSFVNPNRSQLCTNTSDVGWGAAVMPSLAHLKMFTYRWSDGRAGFLPYRREGEKGVRV